jgi:hypothetical protein
MPVSLPTSYDWSSTQAPSGPFGTESISGSESVLGNLSGLGGLGALGSNGVLNFLNGFSSGGINLNNLNRLAGTVGSLIGPGFDVKDSTKALDKRGKKTKRQINKRISNIYPGLTGVTAAEMIPEYERRFAETAERTREQGRADLGIDPELENQYNRLGSRVENIQNQYSLGGRLGGYERLALDPPVVSMDVDSIRGTADWSAPEIARQYSAFTDYSGPQTSRFIYGGKNTAEDIGQYYGNSSDIAKMMDYKTLDAIGRYYNTSGDVAGLMNYGTLA